jgi:hypothetical protein
MKSTLRQVQFTIPEPCNVPWNGMTPVDKDQRHCSSCDKVVTDFSKMSDDELMLYFHHNNGKICGRLANTQLNRPMVLLPEKTQKAKWWRTLMLIPLTLFGKSAKAQLDSVNYFNHPTDTNALSLQNDSTENGFSVKAETVVNDLTVKKDTSRIAVTLSRDSGKYLYVWNPYVTWTFPDSLYPLSSIPPLITGGTMVMIADYQPLVEICFIPDAQTVTYGGLWQTPVSAIEWEPALASPKEFEKSILTILLDTIAPFRKKKNHAVVAKNNAQQIEKPEPYKDVSQQPIQKPKPQQPALPASNEIAGILPEERKKPWHP